MAPLTVAVLSFSMVHENFKSAATKSRFCFSLTHPFSLFENQWENIPLVVGLTDTCVCQSEERGNRGTCKGLEVELWVNPTSTVVKL